MRSSSLLEDALNRLFAGVYATKMIPNNQLDAESRAPSADGKRSSSFTHRPFSPKRGIISPSTGGRAEEKMAVVIQEVVGTRHKDRFYPDISWVWRVPGIFTRPDTPVRKKAR